MKRRDFLGLLCAALVPGHLSAGPKLDRKACSLRVGTRTLPLHGKVRVVDHFPDLKIQLVDHFPDLRVQRVEHFPDSCGKWQFVEHFPDFSVQFVEHFPDLKIQLVDHFPGIP